MDVILGAKALLAPLTGIGIYTAELRRGLRADPAIRSVRCFADYHWLDGMEPSVPPAGLAARLKRQGIELARGLVRAMPAARPLMQRQADRLVAGMLNGAGASLYHEPNFVLQRFDGPTIATIHDLSIYLYPECHPPHRVEYMTRHLPRTFAQASRLITVSDTIRRELIERLGLAPERIVTIPNGVGTAYHPRATVALQPLLASYDLVPGLYLLAVGTLEPRKNLEGLLDAYEALPAPLRRRYPLIVAGGAGWRDERLVARLDALVAGGTVRRLGYVPADDLPGLYAGARGFAFPSLYEGFGLPVLEAAASGVPVLSSAATAMAEVLGNDAILVEPRDRAGLVEGLRCLLEDDSLQDRARAAAPGFAERFGWDRCVARTVALYRAVLA
ncbi:MAG: glycosyltransferase family 1 protein [Aliidongia sp.]